MFIHNAQTALMISVIATLFALFIFGYIKGRFTGSTPFKSALQTTLVGGLAAGIAFLVAKLVS
jgi:vacuolar iron transporter family protein